jgi:hypothetical protein
MRWVSRSVLVLIVMIMSLTGQGLLQGTSAQDATPAASPGAGAQEGFSARTLALGTVDILSPGTGSLAIGRIVVAPGVTVPFDATDPAATLFVVSTGELTFRIAGPVSVARKADKGTPAAAELEPIAADTEFTMGEGDSVLFPPATGGEMRNSSDAEATALVATLAVLGAATPTP